MLRNLIPTLCCVALAGEELVRLDSVPLRTRVSGEELVLNGHERMGTAGLHEDFFVSDTIPGLYLGVGGYGAFSGGRGGFFVVGGTLGWTSPTWHGLGLDVGGFAGGGGEAKDAGQGGGLMLRGHAVASYAVPGGALQAGVAHVDFPDGDITTTGFTAGLVVYDAMSIAGPATAAIPGVALSRQRWGFAPLVQRYWLDDGLDGRANHDPGDSLDLVGVEFTRAVGHGWFVPVMLGGALGGSRAGYMEVLGGVGYGVGDDWRAEARGMVGLGGGGAINTGGGVMLRPEVGLGRRLGDDWLLEARGGRMWALEGDFAGWVTSLALRWDPEQWHAAPGGRAAATIPAATTRLDTWRVALGSTSYRFHRDEHIDVHLIDLSLEKPITDWLAAVGRTRSAYLGDAGGYSEGLFGGRLEWPVTPWLRLGVEGDAGAGGGGALPTGDGLIIGLGGDMRVRVHGPVEVRVGYGRVTGLDDDLAVDALTIGLVTQFTRALAP